MGSNKKILILIIAFGALVRLFMLGDIPFGLFRDEAALGYNAFSVFRTGKDEYGILMPLVFRSFEVFFLPLYVYVSSLLVGLFGLSELSIRLLSALSGVGALVVAYNIARQMWGRKAGLFAAFVLAIAPWHIYFSRGAFEGNLALFLFSLGFYFWIKYLDDKKRKFILFSGLSFALSMYSYQAERLVVPLLVLMALGLSFRNIWKIRIKLLPIIALLMIIIIPLLSLTFKPGGYHRAFGVSVFSKEEDPPGYVLGGEEGLLINNKPYLRARQISALYLSYFSPRNLFFEGDYDKQRSVENFSVLYAFMMPFLFLGLHESIKKRGKKETLLLSWLFLAPLPAAMTGDPFHTYRSLLIYLPYTMFIGLGLARGYGKVKKHNKLFLLCLGVVSFSAFILFVFNYAVITQAARARSWDYGYKQVVDTVKDVDKRSPVVVWDPWTEAYIHFLFFEKVDPSVYHESAARKDLSGVYYSSAENIRPEGFENYEFREVDWREERGDAGTYFVMYAKELPESEYITDPKVELIKGITYPNGEAAYRIVRIKD